MVQGVRKLCFIGASLVGVDAEEYIGYFIFSEALLEVFDHHRLELHLQGA